MENATQGVASVSRLQQAYQRKFDQMSALSEEEIAPINVDIPTVYTLASGVLAKVKPHREAMMTLPFLHKEWIDEVDDCLLALGHAQALHLAASMPVASLPELYAQLLSVREILLADSTALATRGLLPADKLKELRGPTGHSATAFDVLALATILRAHWAQIQGKTALVLSDIERAESLSDQILAAVGERAVSDEQASAAALNRRRAFTLFARAYDELRRGLVYLRWHEGDVDELAPSLYSTRIGRRRRAGSAAEESDTSDVTNQAKTTPAGTTPAVANATSAASDEDSPFMSA